MRKVKEKEFRIQAKTNDLTKHTFQISTSTKRFPKKMRMSLANRLQEKSLDIQDEVLEANEVYGNTVQAKRARREHQDRAIIECKKMLNLINLSYELNYLDDKSCEYWAKMVVDIKYMTMAWIKQTK